MTTPTKPKRNLKEGLKYAFKNLGASTKKVLGDLKENPRMKKIEDDINKIGGGW